MGIVIPESTVVCGGGGGGGGGGGMYVWESQEQKISDESCKTTLNTTTFNVTILCTCTCNHKFRYCTPNTYTMDLGKQYSGFVHTLLLHSKSPAVVT